MSYTYTHKYDASANMWRDETTGELSEDCPDNGVISNSDWNKYVMRNTTSADEKEYASG